MESWIIRQSEESRMQFDKSMEMYNPGSQRYLRDPQLYLSRIKNECNYFDAIHLVNWAAYLKNECVVLDLAGGSGWLSAYLSSFDNVSEIFLLDSSRFFLEKMMPDIVKLMNGSPNKITPIEALFSPLFFEDKHIDVIVMSSALHHTDNMESLLKEIRRVLTDDGFLLILNETPHAYWRYIAAVTKYFVKIFLKTMFREYSAVSPSISTSGYMYDPYLQDKAYPIWYWDKALEKAEFRVVERINTRLFTQKSDTSGLPLMHFICVKK
jgi:SAM-dependent methyltransferase